MEQTIEQISVEREVRIASARDPAFRGHAEPVDDFPRGGDPPPGAFHAILCMNEAPVELSGGPELQLPQRRIERIVRPIDRDRQARWGPRPIADAVGNTAGQPAGAAPVLVPPKSTPPRCAADVRGAGSSKPDRSSSDRARHGVRPHGSCREVDRAAGRAES